ncbi:ribonuclease H-like domain-containing protein [Tanacetum coccineum]
MAGSDNESDDASVHSEATIAQQQQNIQPQIITTVSNNNAKFPYLKKDEYEVWAMKMEYWITNNDMNIWKVIQNGNSLKRTGRDRDGRVIILPPTTADEHIAVQRESKARTTLLQSIPDDHVADFHYMDDARDIWNAVKARFGGNAESKKMRKSMLKQEFSEFRISEAEGLHKGYDRMQKILSQLNQLKAKPEDEDINLKFLRALPSSWSQVALTLKTKGGLELLSFDDLYYKLKTLEVDIKGYSTFSSSQSAGPSHSAFVSTTSASKKMSYADSPSYSSSTYTAPSNSKTGSHRSGNVIEDVLQSFVADTEPEQQLAYEDFEQIEKMDLEEMDLKWQMAMLSVRVHKFEQKAGRKIDFDKKESARFNKKKVRCYKCLQRGHFARECRAKGGNDKQRYSSFKIQEIGKKEEDSKALITVDTLVDWTEHDGQSDGVIAPKEFGMIAGCDTEDAIEEGAAKIYNLITGADTKEASTAGDAGEFALMGVTSEVYNCPFGENELGWDDSSFSVFTTNSEEVEGRPHFNRFAKTDSMKAVPPPLSRDYTPLSDHTDLDESQMSYGTKSLTSGDSNSVSNDFVSCDNSDKSIEVNSNDFASKSLEPKSNDSISCTSTSSVSTSESKAKIESNVGIPIQEPIIFVPQAVLLRTGKVDITPARPQSVPTGRQNRPIPVPTGRGDSPSVTSGWLEEILLQLLLVGGKVLLDLWPICLHLRVLIFRPPPFGPYVYYNQMHYDRDGWVTVVKPSAGQSPYRCGDEGIKKYIDVGCSALIATRKDWMTFNLLKRKQHKATYKAITVVSSISDPLQLLHMDLFGPTSIRSIDHKYYCLVITDDYSRFCWVFFLETKDETYPILKDFISLVENQLNKKRDYSNARTPQQNGVAERKNRTLIEAARTMLADSKLPTILLHHVILNPLGAVTFCLPVTFRYITWLTMRVEETMNLFVFFEFLEEKASIQELVSWMTDSDSVSDEHVILELARLKGQEQRATSDAEILGLGFAKDAEELQKRANINGVSKSFTVECGMRGHLGPACNACTLASPEVGDLRPYAPTWCRAPFEPEGLLCSISSILSGVIDIHYGHVLIHFKCFISC